MSITRKLFLALMIVSSFSTFAREASYVCDNYGSNCPELQLDCYDIVEDGEFNDRALEMCNRMSSASDTNLCLRTIKNARFQSEAVEVCERYGWNATNHIVGCFNAINRKTFDLRRLDVCDRISSMIETNSCLSRIGH